MEAAKRAGADAADAVAVRGVSQGVEVRDGRVEESERSEGDDVGLRVFVGKRQAVVSTNDVSGDNVAKLAQRAVAMARVAPDDAYVGLADPALLARDFPDLDLLDAAMPSTAELERRALEAEAAALAVSGVTKSGGASASTGIGGMVLVTSTGFHGAYLRSSHGISTTAIVGEGRSQYPEYVIPTDPRYRNRAQALHAAAGTKLMEDGGILGKVTELGDQILTIEIASGVQVKVQRHTVTQVLPKGTLKSA